jgi:tetratricopeptide (TPR) repeat protein
MAIIFNNTGGCRLTIEIQATSAEKTVHRGVAWSIIAFTVIGIIIIGLYMGNKFFWNKYKNLTKERYTYNLALKQVKEHPDDINARISLGSALLDLSQFDNATREFQRALTLDPRNETAKYDIAVVLVRQGKLNEAEIKLQEVVKENPKFVQARLDLAIVQMNLEKYDEALKNYNFVYVARPGNADITYQIGIAYEKKGDKSKAREYYTKAAKYDPNFSEAQEALAKLN